MFALSIFAVLETSSIAVGEVVPIPTLPEASIVNEPFAALALTVTGPEPARSVPVASGSVRVRSVLVAGAATVKMAVPEALGARVIFDIIQWSKLSQRER